MQEARESRAARPRAQSHGACWFPATSLAPAPKQPCDARDRRGLRSEAHRREQGHRAKRCGSTQILSPGTSIAKEHVGTGMGETGGTRLADAMIKAAFGKLHTLQHPKVSDMTSLASCRISETVCLNPHIEGPAHIPSKILI